MATTKRLDLDDIGDEELDEAVAGTDGEGDDLMNQEVDFESIKGVMLLPRNEYHLKVSSAKAALSQAGFPKITALLVVQEGEFENAKTFQDFSLAPGAIDRTRDRLVGMGLPSNFKGTAYKIAEAMNDLDFWGILEVKKSTKINPETQKVYDDRNNLSKTSLTKQT